MLKILAIAVPMMLLGAVASAEEYCHDKYDAEITQVNAELGGLLKRQRDIDKRIAAIFVDLGKKSEELVKASLEVPPDLKKIQELGKEMSVLSREKTELEAEGYTVRDRIFALKGNIPAELAGKLRGCIEASRPVNNLVNFTIQSLAILSTGGASMTLPEKSLYVDMSAVLSGYPLGGPKSIVNQTRESVLNALGLGGNNDIGNAVVDPVGAIRRCFGLC